MIITQIEYCSWPSIRRSSQSSVIKLNHAQTTSPYFAHQIKGTDGIFKLHNFVRKNMILLNMLYVGLSFMGFYNSISLL